MRGLRICNVTLRSPLAWLRTNRSAPPQPGGGFVVARPPDAILGVAVGGVVLAGAPVRRDADWGLEVAGNASVTYREDEACVRTSSYSRERRLRK